MDTRTARIARAGILGLAQPRETTTAGAMRAGTGAGGVEAFGFENDVLIWGLGLFGTGTFAADPDAVVAANRFSGLIWGESHFGRDDAYLGAMFWGEGVLGQDTFA